MKGQLLRSLLSGGSVAGLGARSARVLCPSGGKELQSAGRKTWLNASSGMSRQPEDQRRALAVPSAAAPSAAAGSSSDDDAPGQLQLSERIGVIGAGQMATAMIRGWIESGVSAPARICTSNRLDGSQALLTALGLTTFGDAAQGGAQAVAGSSDIILLGVKPQCMADVLDALSPHITPRHLVVSIAAGIKLDTYERALPPATRVVRVMPNTPLLVGAGASAYCLGQHATPGDEAALRALLGASGLVLRVSEDMLDAVTGLSGSGPAFVFMMIEALADGGVAAGLPRDAALRLAAQTVYGSAAMVLHASGDGSCTHPGVLKDRVASPAGTTIAGISVLEQAGVRGAFLRAVAAAAQRSRELSAGG